MAAIRTKLIIGVMLVCTLSVQAGPGDPPVIVLPSARAAQQQALVVQAPPNAVIPKVELLPPPAELASPSKSPLPAAPPLLAPAENTLRKAPVVPTLTPKEVAPLPHRVAEQPSQGPIPSALAPPGESTMTFRSTKAAVLGAVIGTAPIYAVDPPKSPPAADYVKTDDVKALKDEIETLRKEITGLTGKVVDQPKAADIKALKDEVASLKKEIAEMNAKPTEAKAMKEEVDAIRKDVQTLNVFLRETIEGKVEKGFTHEGVIKRLQKLDDSIDALAKKVQKLDGTRVAGSSPLTAAIPAQHGLVRVVNEYPVEIAIVVNGLSHRLEPYSKKDVAVPAGSFKYQLLTSGGAETERSIKESETVTLTIR